MKINRTYRYRKIIQQIAESKFDEGSARINEMIPAVKQWVKDCQKILKDE